jgi:hypothetical protein
MHHPVCAPPAADTGKVSAASCKRQHSSAYRPRKVQAPRRQRHGRRPGAQRKSYGEPHARARKRKVPDPSEQQPKLQRSPRESLEPSPKQSPQRPLQARRTRRWASTGCHGRTRRPERYVRRRPLPGPRTAATARGTRARARGRLPSTKASPEVCPPHIWVGWREKNVAQEHSSVKLEPKWDRHVRSYRRNFLCYMVTA